MKTLSFDKYRLLVAVLLVGLSVTSQAQKMSFSNAFNMLNTGSKSGSSKFAGTGVNMVSINTANYTKKVKVSYGVPIEIVLEYAVVKSRLASDLASDPDTYNNSSGDVQQAFVNLAYGDFVKISDYNKVNVKLNFRFNPAKLVIYGSDEGDFINNTNSSPWDVGVYKTPNTPVSGIKIMVVQK
ncbi:MAG TPA: hypothetical protein VIH57_13725 [Bacteroidales bacterium]